jgi:hypothetical protein
LDSGLCLFRVAGTRIELVSRGYEPRELPLLHPAKMYTVYNISCQEGQPRKPLGIGVSKKSIFGSKEKSLRKGAFFFMRCGRDLNSQPPA